MPRLVYSQELTISMHDLVMIPFLHYLPSKLLDSFLKAELATYLSKAEDVNASVDLLDWWKNAQIDLPTWSSAAMKVLLVQPSSASAERVFSLLNSSFNEQQLNSLEDYVESSIMLQYNKEH